jgi:hypothetical protein
MICIVTHILLALESEVTSSEGQQELVLDLLADVG